MIILKSYHVQSVLSDVLNKTLHRLENCVREFEHKMCVNICCYFLAIYVVSHPHSHQSMHSYILKHNSSWAYYWLKLPFFLVCTHRILFTWTFSTICTALQFLFLDNVHGWLTIKAMSMHVHTHTISQLIIIQCIAMYVRMVLCVGVHIMYIASSFISWCSNFLFWLIYQ